MLIECLMMDRQGKVSIVLHFRSWYTSVTSWEVTDRCTTFCLWMAVAYAGC